MFLRLKLLVLVIVLFQSVSLQATAFSDPSSSNLIRIPLNYVTSSSNGNDLPISIRNTPTRAPYHPGCPVALFYDPSSNSLSLSSEGVMFAYSLFSDDGVIMDGYSYGQDVINLQVPNESGVLTIRIEVGSAVYEGNIEL